MKRLLVVIVLLFIGYNLKHITNHIKSEIKQAEKVQFCNDMYMGRDYMIRTCLAE